VSQFWGGDGHASALYSLDHSFFIALTETPGRPSFPSGSWLSKFFNV